MAQSIKLGNDTYIDETGVAVTPKSKYTLQHINPILYNASITTNAYGATNFGLNMSNYTPLFVFAWSSDYPNGIVASFLVTDTGNVWGQFKDNSGNTIANKTLNVRVGYMYKVTQS